METTTVPAKGLLAGLATIAAFYTQNLTPVFFLMILFEIGDYLTGMAAAKWYPLTSADGWNSQKAIQGFVKKIVYIFLVGVAWGVDFLVLEVDRLANTPLDWGPYFGVFAMFYLILTEAVSIAENAEKMGVVIPFFTAALTTFREKVNKLGEEGRNP